MKITRSNTNNNSSQTSGSSSNRRSERTISHPTEPPKASLKRELHIRKPSPIDVTSTEDEDSDAGFLLKEIRQKRMRTVDITKEVLVLRPKDDYEDILGLTPDEIDNFNDCLDSIDESSVYLYEGREVKDENYPPPTKTLTVFTPKVSPGDAKLPTVSEEKITSYFKKQKELEKEFNAKPVLPPQMLSPAFDPKAPRGRGRPRIYPISSPHSSQASVASAAAKAAAIAFAASKRKSVNFGDTANRNSYTAYDADSDDETFLNKLNAEKGVNKSYQISLSEFELMIAALERALDSAKETLPATAKLMNLKKLCTSFILESNTVVGLVESKFSSSNSSNDKKKPDATWKPSEELVRSDNDSYFSGANFSTQEIIKFSRGELQHLLPEVRALNTLVMLFGSFNRKQGSNTNSPSNNSSLINNSIDPILKIRCLKIYNHWLDKREDMSCSFIRCFQDFIMDHWKKQEIIPKIPEDSNESVWKLARQKLLRIRADLDRARLIMDRVRRREKVKRELNIAAIDSFDEFFASLSSEINEEEEENDGENGDDDSNTDLYSSQRHRRDSIEPLPFTIEYIDPNTPGISDRGIQFSNSFISSRTVEDNFGSDVLNSSHISGAGWSPLEDKFLLLGVAAYGLGSWSKIRELFCTSKTSIYMNQRFQRLARQRQIKHGSGGSAPASRDTSITKLGVPSVIAGHETGLSQNLQDFVNSFTEDSIWEGIAIRNIIETQNPEKRCGRPSKYPVRIPIPKAISLLGMDSLKELGNKYIYDPKIIFSSKNKTSVNKSSTVSLKTSVKFENYSDSVQSSKSNKSLDNIERSKTPGPSASSSKATPIPVNRTSNTMNQSDSPAVLKIASRNNAPQCSLSNISTKNIKNTSPHPTNKTPTAPMSTSTPVVTKPSTPLAASATATANSSQNHRVSRSASKRDREEANSRVRKSPRIRI